MIDAQPRADTVAPSQPTTADVTDAEGPRRRLAHWLRVGFTVALLLFVVAAAVGVFGVRTHVVSARTGRTTAQLEYTSVGRRGVTSAWRLDVVHPGGFGSDIRVRVSSPYLDTFDLRGVRPDPQSATSDNGFTEYAFSPPHGDHAQISLDGEIDPAAEPGRHRGVAVVDAGAGPPLTLHFSTWVWP